MNILGISGVAGSGKDTAADFLMSDHRYIKVALADPLKRIARDVYAFTDDQLWGPSQSRNAPDVRYHRPCNNCLDLMARSRMTVSCLKCCDNFLTPREVLQKLGTEFGRSCYHNTWVDLCLRTAQEILKAPDDYGTQKRYTQKDGLWFVPDAEETQAILGVAIPDVRFRNEINAIQQAGGRVIRVVRPNAGLTGVHGAHASETEMAEIQDSDFDAVVQNDGTLEDLRAKVKALVA